MLSCIKAISTFSTGALVFLWMLLLNTAAKDLTANSEKHIDHDHLHSIFPLTLRREWIQVCPDLFEINSMLFISLSSGYSSRGRQQTKRTPLFLASNSWKRVPFNSLSLPLCRKICIKNIVWSITFNLQLREKYTCYACYIIIEYRIWIYKTCASSINILNI